MAPSADLRCRVALLLIVPALLAGCDTTQRQNERAKLGAQREIASRAPQRITVASSQVRVTDVTLLRRGGLPTVVVELRSSAARPLTDVPIAVGIRRPDGRRVALNERGGLGWFQTHVPAIAARGTATWVFSGRRREQATGRPYAVVGSPASPPLSAARSLPKITASALRSDDAAGAARRVLVENVSDVPQYGLQVYAFARDGARYVEAGKTSIAHLGTGARTTVSVPLSGPPGRRSLQVHAVPTIFE